MSRVYLITALPRLERDRPPTISKADFVRQARHALDGDDRRELELLLLLDEVDVTCAIVATEQSQNPAISIGDLSHAVRTKRVDHSTTSRNAPAIDEIPSFILEPSPQHILLRRTYKHFYDVGGPFIKAWAMFAVDLEEILTGFIAQHEGMAREQFRTQMEGRFDSSSEIIVRQFDKPDLGLGRRFPWIPRVENALKNPDRVECERTLDALRWAEIENLVGIDVFGIDVVLATYLKLRILERHAAWSAKAGQERLNAILHRPDALSSFDTKSRGPDA